MDSYTPLNQRLPAEHTRRAASQAPISKDTPDDHLTSILPSHPGRTLARTDPVTNGTPDLLLEERALCAAPMIADGTHVI